MKPTFSPGCAETSHVEATSHKPALPPPTSPGCRFTSPGNLGLSNRAHFTFSVTLAHSRTLALDICPISTFRGKIFSHSDILLWDYGTPRCGIAPPSLSLKAGWVGLAHSLRTFVRFRHFVEDCFALGHHPLGSLWQMLTHSADNKHSKCSSK